MSMNLNISAIVTCLLRKLELSKGSKGSLPVLLGFEVF